MKACLDRGSRRLPLVLAVVVVATLSGDIAFSAESTTRLPAGRPIVTVGIVYDGPPPESGGLPVGRLQELPGLIEAETTALVEREVDIRFPAAKRLSGDWKLEQIRAAIERLLADPQVDIVITVGIIATHEICRRDDLPKPVIAPIAVDIEAQSLPVERGVDGRLVSGVTNLNYLTSPGTIMRDLRRFREIVPFSRVRIMTDALFAEVIPEVPEAVIAGGKEFGVEIAPPVLVTGSADEALAQLPPDTEAVYVTPLHRMSSPEFDRLVAGLLERRLPSFSLLGRDEVEAGIMAGVRPQTDFSRMARRIALNVQRILQGEDAGGLPVTLELEEKLVINMATATSIGVFPRFRIAMEAEQIWGESRELEGSLTLSQAVREAVDANVRLRSFERRVTAGEENVRRARSFLKPQLGVSTFGRQIDRDRAATSFGAQAQTTLGAELSLRQNIYSDGVFANLDISKDLQRSLELEWQVDRLDVALRAATAYLDLLRLETLERVERENVRLTESNLELARRREQIGFSGPADVYRWESRLATDRSRLIEAHSLIHIALVELNRVLDRPQEDLFEADPPSLVDPELITGFGRLNPYVDNAATFTLFKEFMVQDGLANAPELQAIDAAIAARERVRVAARRSLWAPDLSLIADVEHRAWRGGAGSTVLPSQPVQTDDSIWAVSIVASLPLYAGGARKADVIQTTEELAGLRLERVDVAQRVEQRVRTALYEISSTFPAIELAREAAAASERNLELVTDSYARGLVSVIDLLDAQNSALITAEFAANAEYDFILDLMDLQRATSRFDFFESNAGRDAWFERLETFFKENADRIRWPLR